MKKFILACAALASVASVTSVAQAQSRRESVVLLATTKIGPFDQDYIQINSCAGGERERIAAIRIKVVKRSATIDGLRVNYANGNYDDIPINISLREGERTRWIDLEGRARCVRSIDISGMGDIFRGRATVEIHGLKRERPDWEYPEDRRDDRRDDRGPGRDDRGPRGPRR